MQRLNKKFHYLNILDNLLIDQLESVMESTYNYMKRFTLLMDAISVYLKENKGKKNSKRER